MKRQTPEVYARRGGVSCPGCASENVHAERNVDTDIGVLSQNVSCEDCGAYWTDQYRLVGYSNFTTKAEDEQNIPKVAAER